jgi:hypothetical protein
MKSKWRRYEVLLPHRFNDGRAVPNALLGEAVNEITNRFEAVGFERQRVEGRWHFQGKLYRDVLARVVVDVPDTLQNRQWMKKFKARWKKKLKQIEIWMVSYRIELE